MWALTHHKNTLIFVGQAQEADSSRHLAEDFLDILINVLSRRRRRAARDMICRVCDHI